MLKPSGQRINGRMRQPPSTALFSRDLQPDPTIAILVCCQNAPPGLNLIRLLSPGWQHHALGVFMMLVSDSSEVTQYCDRGVGIGRDERTIAIGFMVGILLPFASISIASQRALADTVTL
jgi:hypothetical protein